MITLGNVTHSVPSVASKAAHALRDTGRMAVFVGTTGHAVAIGYGEAEYSWQVRRQARYLVGVYDDDLADNEGFRAQLIADIRDRVQGWVVKGAEVEGMTADTASIARELVLPWPSRDLHPNQRVHWSKRAKAAKGARADACAIAWAAGWHRMSWPDGPLHVWIDGYPADRRRRDADGLLSSLKPWLDGIADAMQIDDRRFVPHPWVKTDVRKGGEVRVRIEIEVGA